MGLSADYAGTKIPYSLRELTRSPFFDLMGSSFSRRGTAADDEKLTLDDGVGANAATLLFNASKSTARIVFFE